MPQPRIDKPPCFVAIDFETADHGRDSACAVGLVRVADGEIVARSHYLIRPPRPTFLFSYLHGITWKRVANEPRFADLWPRLHAELRGADFVAAHNAPFDRSVLKACCEQAKWPAPDLRLNAPCGWPAPPGICTPPGCRMCAVISVSRSGITTPSRMRRPARIVLAVRGCLA